MKKFLMILSAAMLMLSLCACSKSEPVPPIELSAGSFEHDIAELALPAEKSDFELLDGFEALEKLDLRGSVCYDEILSYIAAHPDVEVLYDVALPSCTVSSEAEALDLSDIQHSDTAKYIELLRYLPGLKSIDLGTESESRSFSLDDTAQFMESYPDIDFEYRFIIWGQEHSSHDTELNFSHIVMDDNGEAVRTALRCMPRCTYVDMDSCGVDNEHMAVIRDENPNVKVVWRVKFGKNYSVRTDEERILASKPSEGGNLDKRNIDGLKYCTEVKYLDIGHNETLGDLSFLAEMPKLEVAIIAMTGARSIEGIQNCTQLEYLEMQTNDYLTDLSPLASLTNLKHLNIAFLPSATDLSPIMGLDKLERLMISGFHSFPQEQIDEFCALHPDCEVDAHAGDPTGGTWRYTSYNDITYQWLLHPRYELLCQQFGYGDNKSYSFYWNDPLY